MELKAPRVDDRQVDENGNSRRFKSVILPPNMRRSPKVREVLPLLYLHGLSSGDFLPTLEEFFGTETPGSVRRRSPVLASGGERNASTS